MSATSPQARPAVLGTIPGDTVCSFSSVVSAFSVGMTGGGSAGPGKLKVENLARYCVIKENLSGFRQSSS